MPCSTAPGERWADQRLRDSTRYDARGWRATVYTTGMEHIHERDRHWMGAHAVARDAAGGVGGATGGQPRWLGGAPLMIPNREAPRVKCEGSSAGRPGGPLHHQLID
jgi:hypothetical protein